MHHFCTLDFVLHAEHGPSTPASHDANIALRQNLLWIPNKGKIPPKLDRIKLFAARALAAKVG